MDLTKFTYTLPTTGAFFFSSCITETAGTSTLTSCNNLRAQLRDILKALKRSDVKETTSVIKVIEDYLPHLFSVFDEVTQAASSNSRENEACSTQASQFIQIKPIITSWRSTFYDNKVPGKAFPRIDFTGIECEIIFVLLTYAYALSNYAMMSAQPGQKSVALLCQAAGIYSFLHTLTSEEIQPLRTGKLCPEMFAEFPACLTNLALGDAQMVALSQLKGKASNSVLCRVAIGASEHFSRALGILSSHPMNKSIPNDFRAYLSRRQKSAMSSAYQYLGLEQAQDGNVGVAIGCFQIAETFQKDEDSSAALRRLTRENQQVTFQALPSIEAVQAKLPSGRDFVKLKPFVAPNGQDHKNTKADQYAGSGGYY